MAIAFASLTVIGFGQNSSSPVGMASYIERNVAHDNFLDRHFSFTEKAGDLEYSKMMLPLGADKKFTNFEWAWNKTYEAEKSKDKQKRGGEYKKNAQLAYNIILALPKELNKDERIEITEKYIQEKYVSKGVLAHYALHKSDDDSNNYHAHILVSTRIINGDKFGKKQRRITPKFYNGKIIVEGEIGGFVQGWVDYQNKYFIENGMDTRVDPIQAVSGKKVGHKNDKEKNEKTNQERKKESLKEVRNPDSLLALLEKRYSYFTKMDISVFLRINGVKDKDERIFIINQIINNSNVISLEGDKKGEVAFTTINRRRKDLKLSALLQQMSKDNNKQITLTSFKKVQKEYTNKGNALDDEKITVIKNILQSSSSVNGIKGKAGTGKSFTIKALRKCYEYDGFNVVGLAPTHSVVKDLTELDGGGFKQGHTAAALTTMIKNKIYTLRKNDVVIIDEAGMLATDQISPIIENAYDVGAKVILVGDDRQLPSIDAGGAFTELRAYAVMEELNTVYRQKLEGDINATTLLSTGKVKEGIEYYKEKETWTNIPLDIAMQKYHKNNDNVFIAFKNETVAGINSKIQDNRIANKKVTNTKLFKTDKGDIFIGEGDKIIFTDKIKDKNIVKGDISTVTKFTGEYMYVNINKKDIKIKIYGHDKFTGFYLGYAITNHQTQGKNFNNVVVVADSKFMWSEQMTTVAYTRHKQDLEIIVDKKVFKNRNQYINPIDQAQYMSTHLNCPQLYDEERAVREVFNKSHEIHDELSFLEQVDLMEDKNERTLKDPRIRDYCQSIKRKMTDDDKFMRKVDYISKQLGHISVESSKLLKNHASKIIGKITNKIGKGRKHGL